ncbi:two-component system, response regulator YesN [Gracilibacillus orientalis]|uniref:Two-component system, response regulator YesN n=1 Tax=Gracilibacillus orientalis TaxID=334253 RepID=A0A1I4IHI2_9BACI|nr:response regulator [Gracilibacillus orientalis]SFL53744.1 two-component system, response regulator YesN [Gracilibacillus orientalis]
MWKVIIVDDERRTRQGIITLVDWKRLGFEVVDTASDGYIAIEKYEQHQPDLIIIDIKMPKRSGIETIQVIREHDKAVKFLIISGYAEFQYAKQAIQYNVEGYLLKPLEEEELINYLKKMHTELAVERKDNINNKHDQFQRYIDLIIQQKISKEVRNFFQEEMKWNYYAMLLIRFFDKKQLDLADIVASIKQYVSKEEGIVFIRNGYAGIWVKESHAGSNTEKVYYSVYHSLKEKNLAFIGAVSNRVEQIESMANCYQQAESYLHESFFYEEEYLITPYTPMIKERSIDKSVEQLSDYKEKLLYAVEISDCNTFKQLMMEVIVLLAKTAYTETEIKQQITMLLTYINNKLTAQHPEVQDRITIKLTDIVSIQQSHTIKQLTSIVFEHLKALSSVIDADTSGLIVKRMIHFINKNYDKNIKLDTMAELLHYHKVYLGKIFKETTGEYFKTYLDKVRIKNSKRLLLKGSKVYEVAKMVGYTTPDYFHSKFKKYEGMSPSEYRKNKKRMGQEDS